MFQRLIQPSTPPVSTQLYVGRGLLTSVLPEWLAPFCGNILLVTDQTVSSLYAADLMRRTPMQHVIIPSGEKAKTYATVTHITDALCQSGLGRDALLIGMGGGITTDLAGFVASTYMRGISLLLIPTTLLGMIDASVGGKTAIDTQWGKNLMGSIYHPKAILADLDTLQTLPELERMNGMAELLKLALIYDASLIPANDESIVRAIEGKIAIIEQDPTDRSLRRILNFGHTMGHALEVASNYEMPHGQAVALGCMAEAHLSMALGYLAQSAFVQTLAMYERFSLRLPRVYTRLGLLQAMARDKKKAAAGVRFVLMDAIGHAVPFEGAYCRAVSRHALEPTLDWMEQTFA